MALASGLPATLEREFPELTELLNHASRRAPEILAHCGRVAAIASPFARALRLNAEDSEVLVLSAYLHDIGKLFVSREILAKPAPLAEPERKAIEQHAALGEAVLRGHGIIRLAKIVGQHHEHFDGTGYPRKYSGTATNPEERIDPLARALAIVDAFVAMIECRPYQREFTTAQALEEIKRCSGTQFDPNIAAAFLESQVYTEAVA